MKKATRLSIGLLIVALGLQIVVPAQAQSGRPSSEPLDEPERHLSAGYDLRWYTVDGGGPLSVKAAATRWGAQSASRTPAS